MEHQEQQAVDPRQEEWQREAMRLVQNYLEAYTALNNHIGKSEWRQALIHLRLPDNW